MSQLNSPVAQAPDEFDAAKIIRDSLQGLEKRQQSLALRFAGDALGISSIDVSANSGASTPSSYQHEPSEIARGDRHPDARQDIRQFIDEKKPKTLTEFVTTVAYYFRFIAPDRDKRETITSSDVTNAARLVGRPRPKFPHLCLRDAKNAGFLDPLGSGAYKINSVGENRVVALPGAAPARADRRRTPTVAKQLRRKALAKKKVARV
jgi:hypothetical protein